MENEIAKLEVGSKFNGYLLVKGVQKGLAKNNNEYLTVILGDKSGEIETKIWDNIDNALSYYFKNNILYVDAVVTEFRGTKQLNIVFVRHADAKDNISIGDLTAAAPISGEESLKEIWDTIAEFEDATFIAITGGLLKKYESDFKIYPAAKKNHHAYVSGLAFHTNGMLKLGKLLASLYPGLNKDLLYAGIILHDLGKVLEYTEAIGTEYSLEGKLKGHISIISEEIAIKAKELGIQGEKVTLLQHMVLSHHGKLDWGSPVKPAVMEAEILHFIDNVDAKMEILRTELDKVETGEFTEKVFALENRSFYKPTI